jgi:hypothetical protein
MLFAIGMMGTLFMTVIAFVNLWHYSELKAALAISPIPTMGLLVAPLVGRLSTRVPPWALGIPALLVMSAGLLALSTFPAEPSYTEVLPALILMGAGIGAAFPACSIGSMGSIQGHEFGLGSGIVNMARQVGFAIGVALLVAVFTGTIDNEIASARRQVTSLTRESGLTHAESARLEQRVFPDPKAPSNSPPEPRTPLEKRAARIVDEHVRDSYGVALRVAGLVTLLGLPFALTMRRRPGETEAAQSKAVQAAAAAG